MQISGVVLKINGGTYVGDTIGSYALQKPHGRGKMIYSNRDEYTGEWVHGKRQGKGIFEMHLKREKYDGQFRDDQFNGFGTYYWARSALRFEGKFLNGKRHGPGTYYYSNGNLQACNYYHNQLHGLSTTRFPDGRTETQMWEKGTKVGEKKIIHPKSSRRVMKW